MLESVGQQRCYIRKRAERVFMGDCNANLARHLRAKVANYLRAPVFCFLLLFADRRGAFADTLRVVGCVLDVTGTSAVAVFSAWAEVGWRIR